MAVIVVNGAGAVQRGVKEVQGAHVPQVLDDAGQLVQHKGNVFLGGIGAQGQAQGAVGNAKCGDTMKMDIQVENGVIVEVKFKTFGCGAAIATSSMATEMVKGKTIEEALKLTNKAVAEALDGLPPVKMHCSLLAEQAIHAAIEDYKAKHPEA